MRAVLTELLQNVRAAGLSVSVAESIDAIRAAAAAGVEREALRESLAAAVVKDEEDRETFDAVFDRFFSVVESPRQRRRRVAAAGETGVGRGPRSEPTDEPAAASVPRRESDVPAKSPARLERRIERPAQREAASGDVARRRRRRAVLRKRFDRLEPDEAEDLAALAEQLARRFRVRLARRHRRDRRGRLDFRRTIRSSISHGGAALRLELRRRRPARADLVVLCDLSGSVRHAAELFARILAPCEAYFRSVRLFAYVDRPTEASVEHGRLVPHEPIDLYAFSDLGRALVDFEARHAATLTRSTVLVVLGDARNNRRPARADVLGRCRARVRALWWLVPEPRARGSTGDSAIASYRAFCDELVECSSAEQLVAALDRLPW